MKIAIATPEQAGNDWFPIPTDFFTPKQIRELIESILEQEEKNGAEVKICTMNMTILNMVKHPFHDSLIDYDDVFCWSEANEKLVPLSAVRDYEWLQHFSLGDLLEYEDLTEP